MGTLLKSGALRTRHVVLAISVFAISGAALLYLSLAATASSTLEAESATTTGAAIAVDDTQASGGKALRFGKAAGDGGAPNDDTTGGTGAGFGSGEQVISTVYTTAYTYYDNTPPGSADISHPVLHQKAGGTGTYADPITVAVGHDLSTGTDVLDFPAGTKMYFADLRRYFIVEDTCGDGATPQNGPCHQGSNADGSGSTVWLDVWIGGEGGSEADVDACAGKITDGNGQLHTVVINPAANYAVASGVGVFHDGTCDANYGNQLLTQ